MVFQSVGLALLGFWLAKEYENNVFLRLYVQEAAWTYLPFVAFVATFSLAVVVSETYARLHRSGGNVVESLAVGAPGASGPLLTGGFERGPAVSRDASLVASAGDGSRDASDTSLPAVSLTSVFTEWRPPAVLKRVGSAGEQVDPYAPRPFPVVRRLKPAREFVEDEAPAVTPRPLNRIGGALSGLVPLPPVLRQIGSGEGKEDSELEESPEESAGPAKPRGPRKKRVVEGRVTSDLTNDLGDGE